MATASENHDGYALLVERLKILLPEEYKDTYEGVQPVSMGSAGLKYDEDGRVAWDEIWQTFCHLAMAGGPPHRGKLLEPSTEAEIEQEPARYEGVVSELCRGIGMVSGLAAEPAETAGWIHVDCPSTSMAGWLARAITMENVSAHVEGMVLHLPAGPHFRVEKESKNVVTAIAKTCHYWLGHTSVAQHRAIADLLRIMESESPLIQPPFAARAAAFETLRQSIAADILLHTGLQATGGAYYGWMGVDCGTVPAALWMMRMMAACNVLARREDSLLYVPVNPSTDPGGEQIAERLAHAHRVARAHGAL